MTTTSGDEQAEVLDLGFDPDALREKYRLERDKRLRADGIAQYRPPTGDFSRYVDDPYVAPGFRRDPLVDEVDAVVVGGGIGGLLAGARLRQAGLGRIRIVDKAGDFGGTWYWNRYPGAQCDIESYIYLPLLEETGYIPTEKYARGPEILEYLQSLGRRFDLYEDACFQTEITDVWWDDADGRWVVRTDRDDQIRARFVVLSTGLMSRAKLPGIPGIEGYKGHSFHTSRWDYEYTGGGTDGGLVGLEGKRVAVVGTGASAVQCVPHVAASAEHLYVFQRTPSSISERGNAPTDPAWASSLEPGWHEERMTNFNILVSGGHQDVDLVGDGWTDLFRHVQGFLAREAVDPGSEEAIATALELADFTKMEQLRARIDATVEDPATAEALKPYYRMFCKRPCFSDDYLPTFNRPNVTLVDTGGQGVERFTETGAVIDGQEYELDCVIFATGFEIGTDFTRRIGFDVVGRDGVKLSEKWAEGLSTFHGFYTHGFPNMFFLGITQTGLTPNVQHMLDEQTQHVGRVLQHSHALGATRVEASLEAERAWCETMRELAVQNSFLLECTPGYYNQEGRPTSSNSLFSGQYGAGSVEFFGVLRQWCDEGGFAGLDIR
jgi:cation diffusion facilitator CzcD-associated flavoprotein CzcO